MIILTISLKCVIFIQTNWKFIYYRKTYIDYKLSEVHKKFNKKNRNTECIYNNPIFGRHLGYKRLLAKIKLNFNWKAVWNGVKYVKHCQTNKMIKHTKELLAITPTAMKPFDLVVIDTIRSFHMSEKISVLS